MVIEALLPSLFSSDLTGDAQGRRGTLIKKKKESHELGGEYISTTSVLRWEMTHT
jgi:hypothetical protein